jgi:hypothetical protein
MSDVVHNGTIRCQIIVSNLALIFGAGLGTATIGVYAVNLCSYRAHASARRQPTLSGRWHRYVVLRRADASGAAERIGLFEMVEMVRHAGAP